jgi:hypothetical protein
MRLRRPARSATRRTFRPLVSALCLATSCLRVAANAPDDDEGRFSIDGFGTLGIVHSDEREADFLGDVLTRRGAGYSGVWSADVDSRLGLQLSAELSPRVSTVLQVISEQRPDGGYKPKVEWANVRLALTPEFDVRVGRVVLPSFLMSDHRKVSYANPWVRPPLEVYGLNSITSSDGINIEYRTTIGSASNTLQANVGGSSARLPDGGPIEGEDTLGITDTLQWGNITLRAAYLRSNVTLDSINQLFVAFRQFGPEGNAIAERYEADGDRLTFVALGASYDPGAWFLTGEYGRVRSDSLIGGRHAWYVSAGTRVDTWTPYVTVARTRPQFNLSDPGLTASNYPPELAPAIAALNAALNDDVLGNKPSQDSLAIGMRWDFIPNAALKFQYDYLCLDDGSIGVLGNAQPDFEPGGNVGVFSISLDFVF